MGPDLFENIWPSSTTVNSKVLCLEKLCEALLSMKELRPRVGMLRGENDLRSSLRFFFCPKSLVHPILSKRAEGVFRGSFSPRAQNAKVGWELAVDFLLLARIRSRILLETGASFVTHFVTNFVPKSPRIFQASFPVLFKKIHAKSTPASGPKSTPILETFFFSGFSGCSTLVCVAAFGCQYVYADQRRLVS